MLKLSVSDIVHNNENCYSFVVAVSKRARQIAEEQQEQEEISHERPVHLAVEEFIEGKYRIIQPDLNEQAEEEAVEAAKEQAEEEAIAKMRAEDEKNTDSASDAS